MRKSRFTEEQIIGVLKQAETTTVKIACAKHNISEATYYVWKRKFGRLAIDEARRLRALENENTRLKHIIADQAVQIQILKEVNARSDEPAGSNSSERNFFES